MVHITVDDWVLSTLTATALERNGVGQMAAKYILAVIAVAFLAAAVMRLASGGGISHPQTKAWLTIAVIFAAVSAWLFSRG